MFPDDPKPKWWMTVIEWLVLGGIILFFVALRLQSYGDPTFSIGAVDTSVYVSGAEFSILDRNFWASGRPFTVPLLFKIVRPEGNYPETLIGLPFGNEGPNDLIYQPDFVGIVVIQMVLSILGWATLAGVMYHRLRFFPIKVITACLVLLFGFSPQLAEWDRILLSESLSFSLFAMVIALTIELVFREVHFNKPVSNKNWVLLIAWFIILILWVFTRDTNAYVLLVTIVMILVVLIIPVIRRSIHVPILIGGLAGLVIVMVFQQTLMRSSTRWVLPLLTNISMNILPFEDRVDFFAEMGMPVSDEILALKNSMGGEFHFYEIEDFMEWVYQKGFNAYTRFLINYPRWAVQKIYRDMEVFFGENLQPWFSGPADYRPMWFIRIGDYLHIKSHTALLLNLLMTLLMVTTALITRERYQLAWGWIGAWLLACELCLLFISYHGDPRSVIRHTLVAVMPIRLSLWLLLALLSDFLCSMALSRPTLDGRK